MHSTIDASNAGQTTPGTMRAASTSIATESAILTNAHVSMLTALGDRKDGAAGAMARPVYDAPHAVLPWGWKVGAYLWTKSIAAGALLLAAMGVFDFIGTIGSGWLSDRLGRRKPLILLGYGLCGNGLDGLSARHTRLVLPRAHDCIGLLMGGTAGAAEGERRAHPA